MNENQKAKIVKAYLRGKTIAQVSDKFGIGVHIVRKILIGSGVKIRPKGVAPNIVRNAFVLGAIEDGKSYDEIAAEFGITRQRVGQISKRANGLRNVSGKPWDDPEEVKRLEILWDSGLSARLIGRRLNRSKSSIVGKVHRLELPLRPHAILGRQ